jgi:imidazolonepropionase-like amidohydrolase
MLTLTNARLFDGATMLKGRRSLSFDGDRIVSIGEGRVVPEGHVIDVQGMTLMPGLITCHMHSDFFKYGFSNFLAGEQLGKERPPGVLMAIGVRTGRVLLESGFTGFVGAGCSNDVDVQLKMSIAEDIVPGPRILASGHHVGTTADANDPRKWWQRYVTPGIDTFANGPDGVRALVREEIRRGVEIIKIFASSGHAVPGHRGKRNMARDEIEAIVEAAHDRGVRVRAHVCHKDLILECVELGVDVIDHGDEVDEECVEAMRERGVFWVPSLRFLQEAIDQGWPDPDGSTRYAYDNIRRILPHAQKAGVRILLGDDYGGAPLLHEVGIYASEMSLYSQIDGISSTEVLGWATKNAGLLLGTGDAPVGVLQAGAMADVIVVNGDPSADITVLSRPQATLKAVVRDGKFAINRLEVTKSEVAAISAAS